ncbi:MAG: FUN14 domain-containing protein [Candidatus Nitrosopolaris sp.]
MITTEIIPLASTLGGGFLAGALAGYALKKVIKLAAVIVGMFIAALAYLEYQRIIQVDWTSLQALSQSGITWLTNAVMCISNNIGVDHLGASNCAASIHG